MSAADLPQFDPEYEDFGEDGEWDEAFAEELLGASLLVELVYLDHAGNPLSERQVFGHVESADARKGIVVRMDDGETFTIAPILEAIDYAERGTYFVGEEGREIEDPDFVAQFTVSTPPLN